MTAASRTPPGAASALHPPGGGRRSFRDADLRTQAPAADGADAAGRRHDRVPPVARAARGRGAPSPRRRGRPGGRRRAPGGAGPAGTGPRALAPVPGLDLGARARRSRALDVDRPAGGPGDPDQAGAQPGADGPGDAPGRRRRHPAGHAGGAPAGDLGRPRAAGVHALGPVPAVLLARGAHRPDAPSPVRLEPAAHVHVVLAGPAGQPEPAHLARARGRVPERGPARRA